VTEIVYLAAGQKALFNNMAAVCKDRRSGISTHPLYLVWPPAEGKHTV
jgi:hypothetical protein